MKACSGAGFGSGRFLQSLPARVHKHTFAVVWFHGVGVLLFILSEKFCSKSPSGVLGHVYFSRVVHQRSPAAATCLVSHSIDQSGAEQLHIFKAWQGAGHACRNFAVQYKCPSGTGCSSRTYMHRATVKYVAAGLMVPNLCTRNLRFCADVLSAA